MACRAPASLSLGIHPARGSTVHRTPGPTSSEKSYTQTLSVAHRPPPGGTAPWHCSVNGSSWRTSPKGITDWAKVTRTWRTCATSPCGDACRTDAANPGSATPKPSNSAAKRMPTCPMRSFIATPVTPIFVLLRVATAKSWRPILVRIILEGREMPVPSRQSSHPPSPSPPQGAPRCPAVPPTAHTGACRVSHTA